MRVPLQLQKTAATDYLYFEGANQVAGVYGNGRHAAKHVGGYSVFAVDITDLVTPGADNELEVRVDNRHDDTIPPLNADFTFYGGIYRDVWLLDLTDVHFAIREGAYVLVVDENNRATEL